jgi:hypothetical protein
MTTMSAHHQVDQRGRPHAQTRRVSFAAVPGSTIHSPFGLPVASGVITEVSESGGPEQIKTLKSELQKIARDLPPVG